MGTMYYFIKSFATVVVQSYFSEVSVVGIHRVPVYGPVIFVGNHNNQFVDGCVLMACLPRVVKFLIAEVSLARPVIGPLASRAGVIGVKRAQDMIYTGMGSITGWHSVSEFVSQTDAFNLELSLNRKLKASRLSFDAPSMRNSPISLKMDPSPQQPDKTISEWGAQSIITGNQDCRFPIDCKKGDKIRIRSLNIVLTVVELLNDSTVLVTEPVDVEKQKMVTGRLAFDIIPKVDQSEIFEQVTLALSQNATIGVFPEGGSHDRPQLMPLKPGVAIMALNAIASGIEDVLIVPVGLYYFQPEKFGSKASLEIGNPLEIPPELVEMYTTGNRRAAVDELMEHVKESMLECMLTAPDISIIQHIQLCASLYPPERLQTSTEMDHSLYHLFSILFRKYAHLPEMKYLEGDLSRYHSLLEQNGIPDNEVWQLRQSAERALVLAFRKLLWLIFYGIIALAALPLWGPIRFGSSYLAERHRREALTKSKVKIRGSDVLASYKIICLILVVPMANVFYGFLFGICICRSWSGILFSIIAAVCLLPALYYYSMKAFSKCLPIVRHIRCLFRVAVGEIYIWEDREKELQATRADLQLKVRNFVSVCLSSGPQMSQSLSHYNLNGGYFSSLIDSKDRRKQYLPYSKSEIKFVHTDSGHQKSKQPLEYDVPKESISHLQEESSAQSLTATTRVADSPSSPPQPVSRRQPDKPYATPDVTCLTALSQSQSRVTSSNGAKGGRDNPLAPRALSSEKKLAMKTEFERLIPSSVLDADTRRLCRMKNKIGPIVTRRFLESKEEIL